MSTDDSNPPAASGQAVYAVSARRDLTMNDGRGRELQLVARLV